MYSSNNFNKMFKMLISPLVMNLTKEGLAIVGQSIIPPMLSLEHLGHEPDQGGAGHSRSVTFFPPKAGPVWKFWPEGAKKIQTVLKP